MGLVTFLRGESSAPFDHGELALANELATRTAVCIDNARRYTRERASALTLQRNLLPQDLPEQSAVDVAYRYLPSDIGLGVGGDWFDVIALSGTRVGLVVGDVVGHGLHAAATMGRLRTTVTRAGPAGSRTRRAALPPGRPRPPGRRGAGGRRARRAARRGSGRRPACTPSTTRSPACAPLARAGHPPPAIVDPERPVHAPRPPAGSAAWASAGLPFESLEISLAEGSLLALFTDGLVQDRDRDIDTGVAKLGRRTERPRVLAGGAVRPGPDASCSPTDRPPTTRPCCSSVRTNWARTRSSAGS